MFFTLSACLLGGQGVTAQEKPFWADGFFADAENSYIEVTSATDYDQATARQKAYDEIIKRRSIATGTNAQVSTSQNMASIESSHNLIVKSRIIDEYVERTPGSPYKVYLLVQTAKNPTYEYEDVSVTRKYPFSGRCFVPGAAQIWKGNKGKGGFFIAATALGAGGIVASFCMKSSYEKLIQEDPKYAMEYSQKADMWQNIGFGCIAFTAAIYLWNVIDGAVAPGKEHVWIRKSSKIKGVSLAPTASPYGDFGLAMQLKF